MGKDNVISMAGRQRAETQPSLEKILSSPKYSRHRHKETKMAAALSQVSMGVRLTQALPPVSCWLLHQHSHTKWGAAVPESHYQEWQREMEKPICTTKLNRQQSGVQRMHKTCPRSNIYPAKTWQPKVTRHDWVCFGLGIITGKGGRSGLDLGALFQPY